MATWTLISILLGALIHAQTASQTKPGLLVFTVASERTDGFLRFMNAADKYGHHVTVLGMGAEWQGGNVVTDPGGGYKVNLLRAALEEYRHQTDTIIMFVDSYDLLVTASAEQIVQEFAKFTARVVFSAEDYCWPDPHLEKVYPAVKHNEYRFLNSGGFIGYAPELYAILTSSSIGNLEDDQLFYTKVFLHEKHREKLQIKLDHRADIFQCLNGALEEVKMKFKGGHSYLYNTRTGTSPLVIHGNGPIKIEFNNLANYLADQWTPTTGCQACKQDTISLEQVPREDYPVVLVVLIIDKPTPFVSLYLEGVASLDYPKHKIHIYLHNTQDIHEEDLEDWLKTYKDDYASVKTIHAGNALNVWDSRNNALEECTKLDCSYLFCADGEVQITEPRTLIHLIETNRSIISPLMIRPGKMWSTFWGALSKDGFYKRSDDYVEIIQNKRRGIWNVPYIAMAYLIHGSLVPSLKGRYISGQLDSDMAFAKNNRENGLFMYVDNQMKYGFLSTTEGYRTTNKYNDLWTVNTNKELWQKKYLAEGYWTAREENTVVEQPCPDVFRFPFATQAFTDQLVEEAEILNQWSDGTNDDPRLAGGYENVPTVDTHMTQLGWEQEWLYVLREYIAPMANKVYKGYTSEGRATMNFLVRYKPGEQDHLRPHQDTSTYSLNIALNTPNIDFEGGGTHFLRYNCTASGSKGGIVMHPGRLTHQHEGIRTTKGTRYIMVCFVDP